MDKNFFGQHIASEIILSALKGNSRRSISNKKPLLMSFHGWTGCGKNFISDLIANHMFGSKNIQKLRYHVIHGPRDNIESNIFNYKVCIICLLFIKPFTHMPIYLNHEK